MSLTEQVFFDFHSVCQVLSKVREFRQASGFQGLPLPAKPRKQVSSEPSALSYKKPKEKSIPDFTCKEVLKCMVVAHGSLSPGEWHGVAVCPLASLLCFMLSGSDFKLSVRGPLYALTHCWGLQRAFDTCGVKAKKVWKYLLIDFITVVKQLHVNINNTLLKMFYKAKT